MVVGDRLQGKIVLCYLVHPPPSNPLLIVNRCKLFYKERDTLKTRGTRLCSIILRAGGLIRSYDINSGHLHHHFWWVVSDHEETGPYFCTKLAFLFPSPNTPKAGIEKKSHIFSVIMQPTEYDLIWNLLLSYIFIYECRWRL